MFTFDGSYFKSLDLGVDSEEKSGTKKLIQICINITHTFTTPTFVFKKGNPIIAYVKGRNHTHLDKNHFVVEK